MSEYYCLSCEMDAYGEVCYKCGELSAKGYDPDGFIKCRDCSQIYRYKVKECSTCKEGDEE